jgi:hypothetical protein
VITSQTGDKAESVGPFQQRAFFLDSNQQCSSVKPIYFKEIIGWSPTASSSSEAEKVHSSVKPTIARGSTGLTGVSTFSDSFFSNDSIRLAAYISASNGSHSALSRIRTLHTYPRALRAHRTSFIHLWSSQVIKNLTKAKRLRRSSFVHHFLVIGSCSSEGQDLLLLVIGSTLVILVIRVTFRACQGVVEVRRRSWWLCTWFELHHAGDGERRLLVSTLVLVTWEVTRPLVGVTTWIRGDCQIIDTTRKKSSCLFYFQAFTLCLLLCLVSLACLYYLLRVACVFFN